MRSEANAWRRTIGWLALAAVGCGNATNADDGDAKTDAEVTDTLPPASDAKHDVQEADVTDLDFDHREPLIDTELLVEGNYFLFDDDAITSDGFIIALNADKGMVQAVPLGVGSHGGTAIDIVKGTADAIVGVDGSVVFVMTNVDATTRVATLGVWTNAGGYHELSKSAVASTTMVAASVDGSAIAYTDGTIPKYTSVWVADATGASPTMVFGSAMNEALCSPYLAGTSKGVAVAACKPSVSGFPSATLAVFDRSGTGKALAFGVQSQVSVDATGRWIYVSDTGGLARVYADDGSSYDTIASNVLQGMITPEGKKVVWISLASTTGTDSGPVFSAIVSSTPTPIKIADAAAQYLFPVTAGAKYAIYATTIDATTFQSDLHYAFVDGSAPPIDVSTDPHSLTYGDAITADQSYALFFRNEVGGAGDLQTLDLTTPGAKTTTQANAVWVVRAPHTSLILYNDNWTSGGNGNEGVADIRLLDVATGTRDYAAIQAENNFFLTHDHKMAVFATSDPSFTKAGIYVYMIP
jgi:hypothetical protein